MSVNFIIGGFSLTNRMLLYANALLAPAQFFSGIDNNCPSNLGFLAYNMYNQILLDRAVQHEQLNAFCLVLPHLNLIFALTYLGGITSGNLFMGGFLGFGTAATILLNNVTAWISWIKNQPKGIGRYHFFFFGYRTLNEGWHKFFLVWQIFDTFVTAIMVVSAIVGGFSMAYEAKLEEANAWGKWGITWLLVPLGALLTLVVIWPLILWTEMIVKANHVESPTDWVAVWLFVAQVVAMLLPPLCS